MEFVVYLLIKYWWVFPIVIFLGYILPSFLVFYYDLENVRNYYPYNQDGTLVSYFHLMTRGLFRRVENE